MTIIANHMNTLGLQGEVSPEVVRKAWNEMVKKHHPDVTGNASSKKIIEINDAYEALKNGVEYTVKGAQSTSRPGSSSRTADAGPNGEELKTMDFSMPKAEIPKNKLNMLMRTYIGVYGKLPTRNIMDRIAGRRKDLPKLYLPSHVRIDTNKVYFTIPGKSTIRKGDQIALFNFVESDGLFRFVNYTMFRVIMRQNIPSDSAAVEVRCDGLVDGYKDVRVFIERE